MSELKQNFFARHADRLVFLTLAALVLIIYYQTVGFAFINFDDNLYVYQNQFVLSGLNWQSVKWAFTSFFAANWHPLTWISHALDAHFFGANPGGHHATNVLFHLLNSILAFVVFRQMTGDFWKSAIVAALFAVHPTHVESVAWVSERKDVLSTLFWLLTMLAYFKYAEVRAKGKDTEQNINKMRYFRFSPSLSLLLVVILFALGLMAKPMLVTLPFVLLLCDYWALERLQKLRDLPPLIFEKIPLFVLSAISSYITLIAQKASGAVESLDFLPLGTRILNAVDAYVKYIGMLLYPRNLAFPYPYNHVISLSDVALPIIVLGGITAFCVWQMFRRKYLLMGWLWFLGTLVPVIGLVQVGAQAMADRYTYVPYFGLFVMIVWGTGDIFEKLKIKRNIFLLVFILWIIVLTFVAYQQTSLWRNSEILYRHVLSVTQGNFLTAHNLCHHLLTENRLEEAESYCEQSIGMNPNHSNTYNTLGIVQMKLEKFSDAEKNFRRAIELSPTYWIAYSNLSTSLSLQQKPEEAEKVLAHLFNTTFENTEPGTWTSSIRTLGLAYFKQKNYEKAVENFRRVLYLTPDQTDVRTDLALALFELKNYDEALEQIELSLRENPNDPRNHFIYGLVLLEKNRQAEAAQSFEKALQLKPDFAEAREKLKKLRGEK